MRTHPFESHFLRLLAPHYKPGSPLPVVGRLPAYKMLKNNLFADPDLASRFGDELDGQYAPADVSDVPALLRSFDNYARRDYDTESINTWLADALRVTCEVTPPVEPVVLTPQETIGICRGEKSSGYKCLGTKYAFHSRYLEEMTEALADPKDLLTCVPIYTVIPKVEIRKVTKPARDLSYPPAWFTDLTIMLEKDFFLETMKKWPESPIRVGIPLPQGWPFLVHHLLRFARPHFTTMFAEWDAKQFDRSHPIEITISWYEFMKMKNAFDSVEIDEELQKLFNYVNFWSCFRLVHLPDGRVVLVFAGIYSGDVSTTNKNSYFHIVRLALCWCLIFGTIEGFKQFVRQSGLSVFGDDGICAAHNPRDLFFLENLAQAWERLFGAELIIHISPQISEVSFLGKRSLGDDSWSRNVPVSSDLDRQIASLVHKTKGGKTPIQRLSKLVAHRQLLAGYSYTPSLAVTENTVSRNNRGYQDLVKLDAAIKDHLALYSMQYEGDYGWYALEYLATIPPRELFSLLLVGSETPFPE